MVEIGTVLSFIQAFGIIVGVAYYVLNIQNNQRNQQLTLEARQTQIFLQLVEYLKIESAAWAKFMLTYEWNDFEDYMKKYGPINNPHDWEEQFKHLITYEGLGIMVSKNMIDISLVYEAYGDWVMRYWEKYYPVMIEFRKTYGPEYLEWTEYLIDELKKYRVVKYGPNPSRVHSQLAT